MLSPRFSGQRNRGLAVVAGLPLGTVLLALAVLGSAFVRVIGIAGYSGYIYDESYYVVAAQNLLGIAGAHGASLGAFVGSHLVRFTDPNLTSAPPLGKEFIAASISIFGNHPWAWRLPGALAEIALPFLVYGLARRLFPQSARVALLAGLFSALDPMSIALAHTAILDSTAVPLAVAGLYETAVLADALRHGRQPAAITLWFAGFWLGASFAVKWTGAQALALSWLLVLWGYWKGWPRLTFAQWMGLYARLTVWPLAIYIATYAWAIGPGWGEASTKGLNFFIAWFKVQRQLVHGMWGLDFHHPWLSSTSTWFFLGRPTYLLSVYPNANWHVNIYAVANPVVVWLGGIGLLLSLWRLAPMGWKTRGWAWITRGDSFAWGALWLWTACFYGTWFLSPRVKFFYYFFPMLPVLGLSASALLVHLWERRARSMRIVSLVGVGLAALVALYLLPLGIGISVPVGAYYRSALWPKPWKALPTRSSATSSASSAPRIRQNLVPWSLPTGLKISPPHLVNAWRQWQGSPAHDAAVNFAPLPALKAQALPAAGAVHGGVTVTPAGTAFLGTAGNTVEAWNLRQGALEWRQKVPNTVETTPIQTGNRLVVGLGNPTFLRNSATRGWIRGTGQNGLWALDASTGQVLWHYSTRGEIMATPAVVAGRVYAITGDGSFIAVDLATGHLSWSLSLQGFDSYSAPAVANGVAYFAVNRYTKDFPAQSSTLYAVDLTTRSVLWKTALPVQSGLSDCSPAVANGLVFVAGVNRASIPESSGPSTASSALFAVDAQTGSVLWQKPLGTGKLSLSQPEVGAPMVLAHTVYEPNPATGTLSAFTEQGILLWKSLPLFGPVSAPPVALDSGHLLVASQTGLLAVVAAKTGLVSAMRTTLTGGLGSTPPTLVNNNLVFGTESGWLDVLPLDHLSRHS